MQEAPASRAATDAAELGCSGSPGELARHVRSRTRSLQRRNMKKSGHECEATQAKLGATQHARCFTRLRGPHRPAGEREGAGCSAGGLHGILWLRTVRNPSGVSTFACSAPPADPPRRLRASLSSKAHSHVTTWRTICRKHAPDAVRKRVLLGKTSAKSPLEVCIVSTAAGISADWWQHE